MKLAETFQLFERRNTSSGMRKYTLQDALFIGLVLALCLFAAWLMIELPFVPVLG